MQYETPQYTVVIVTKDGTKYYVKSQGLATQSTSIVLTEAAGQLAQRAVIKLANFQIPGAKGGYPSSLFPVKSLVYIYAKGVGKTANTEVFRGFIWENKYTNKKQKEVMLTCYDNLIYFMNSQTSRYFSKGKSTKTILSTICKAWGVKLNYSYESIKHPKMCLAGTLADVLTDGILDKVKAKKDKKYVIQSIKGVLNINTVGKNSTVYIIDKAGRGTEIGYIYTTTMEGMVTKVLIAGKTNSNGKVKIEASAKKNTKAYGTLQKVIQKEEDVKLKEVKTEAKQILKEHAQPKKTYDDVEALDIPWVRKGHKIGICLGGTTITYCIVTSIIHNIDEGIMTMDLIKA